jgi:hypothetical protein
MPTWGWIPIGIAIVIIVLLAAWAWWHRRSVALRQRFGSEYDRTVEGADRRSTGERVLRQRERQRADLDIRPLSPTARTRYADQWRDTQQRFVDQPDLAVVEADTLLAEVMAERGYPVDDFDAQADLISVDHPDLVQNYRFAHRVTLRNQQQQASTEELRDALLRYRSLFEELLRPDGAETTDDDGSADRPHDAAGAPGTPDATPRPTTPTSHHQTRRSAP